ncbi:hypothetical protein EK21DRAFT_62861 [Setomelanomma holmii]|uniref:Uncharacterized protein n=1 Tax=Setomelanomma holmii TaxID=210430 RepID=A0A9P4HDM4_9PLEO|nr:hypothetical protein EK21DRAFT_62861 [Setomelanomma holmii]
MPIFATFVLGKKENYFFNTPTHWAWHNLPPDIEALFTKTPAIKDVIEFALGSNGTYFVSYRDHDGQVLCKHYNLPNALTSWLYCSQPTVVRDLTTMSITLGPYDSYYAWDKASASWSNLPPKLEKSILNRLESQDTWKTTWKANGAEAPSFGLHLFPSHPDAYVLITTAGKSFSNLPEFTWVDYNKISPALPSFVQSMQPIPPIPQPKQPAIAQAPPFVQYQQAYQQPYVQPQQNHNCCPPTGLGAPHNCCPQQPTQPRPASAYAYGAPLGSQFYTNPPAEGQQSGYTNGGYAGGPVYR